MNCRTVNNLEYVFVSAKECVDRDSALAGVEVVNQANHTPRAGGAQTLPAKASTVTCNMSIVQTGRPAGRIRITVQRCAQAPQRGL
jgi:hypothetical protein